MYPLWKSCDYGYTPTACDEALGALDRSRFPEDLWAGVIDAAPVCEKEANADACSPECTNLIDAVVEHCDTPAPGAKFAPNVGYLDETHTLIDWKYPKSMQWLGFDPNKFDILGMYTLSKPCWANYAAQNDGGASSSADNTGQNGSASSTAGSLVPTTAILVVIGGMLLAHFSAGI